jgi:hypothetical protein
VLEKIQVKADEVVNSLKGIVCLGIWVVVSQGAVLCDGVDGLL